MNQRAREDEHNASVKDCMTAEMHTALIAHRPQETESLSAKNQDYAQ